MKLNSRKNSVWGRAWDRIGERGTDKLGRYTRHMIGSRVTDRVERVVNIAWAAVFYALNGSRL